MQTDQFDPDYYHCAGHNCPSAAQCQRYAQPGAGDSTVIYAAFYARREPGDSACDLAKITTPNTFTAEEARENSDSAEGGAA